MERGSQVQTSLDVVGSGEGGRCDWINFPFNIHPTQKWGAGTRLYQPQVGWAWYNARVRNTLIAKELESGLKCSHSPQVMNFGLCVLL